VPIIRPANPLSTTIPAPASKVAVPATTVFVGNISEKCPDDLVKKILLECGVVSSW
jgi:hypothetical protein